VDQNFDVIKHGKTVLNVGAKGAIGAEMGGGCLRADDHDAIVCDRVEPCFNLRNTWRVCQGDNQQITGRNWIAGMRTLGGLCCKGQGGHIPDGCYARGSVSKWRKQI
jgi:hypothetical protein